MGTVKDRQSDETWQRKDCCTDLTQMTVGSGREEQIENLTAVCTKVSANPSCRDEIFHRWLKQQHLTYARANIRLEINAPCSV